MITAAGSPPPEATKLPDQVNAPLVEIEARPPPGGTRLLNTSTAFGLSGLTNTEFSFSGLSAISTSVESASGGRACAEENAISGRRDPAKTTRDGTMVHPLST